MKNIAITNVNLNIHFSNPRLVNEDVDDPPKLFPNPVPFGWISIRNIKIPAKIIWSIKIKLFMNFNLYLSFYYTVTLSE
jgi:hypothetical protein